MCNRERQAVIGFGWLEISFYNNCHCFQVDKLWNMYQNYELCIFMYWVRIGQTKYWEIQQIELTLVETSNLQHRFGFQFYAVKYSLLLHKSNVAGIHKLWMYMYIHAVFHVRWLRSTQININLLFFSHFIIFLVFIEWIWCNFNFCTCDSVLHGTFLYYTITCSCKSDYLLVSCCM